MRRGLTAALLALGALFVASQAAADQITLSNGKTVQGRVISRTGDRVRVEINGTIMVLEASSIASIEPDLPYENTLMRAKTSFQNRNALQAIDLLFQARNEGAPEETLRELIEAHNGGIVGMMRSSRPSDRANLRRALIALMNEGLLNNRALFLNAQNFFEMEDWENTAEALARIEHEYLQANPTMRQWSLEFMREMVKRLLARGEFEAALGYVERMKLLTHAEASPQLPLAQLTAAAAAREKHDYQLAFRVIAEELHETVPEIARNRAFHTIEHLKQWASRSQQYSEAREALAPIRSIFPVEYAEARNQLVELEAGRHLENDLPGMAKRLIDTVPEPERTSALKDLYLQSQHLSRLAEIGDTDALELLKHGRWCAENGLLDEALLIFNQTRDNPNLKDLSEELIANARQELDTILIEQAQEKFEVGNMPEVLALTERILQHPGRGSALSKEAERLSELARKSMARERELRPYQAEVFFQQAERAHFQQKPEEAYNLASLVIKEYPETPAAGRAAQLMPEIIRALELAFLEGRTTFLPAIEARDFPLERMQRQDKLGEEVRSLLDAVQKESNRGG